MWSKSGHKILEIFEDVSSSPASILAARCAFAVLLLKNWAATYRDAVDAYLQVLIESNPSQFALAQIDRRERDACYHAGEYAVEKRTCA